MIKYIFIFILSFQYIIGQVTNLDCVSATAVSNGFSVAILPNTGYGAINDLPTGNIISNPQTNVFGNNSGCLLANEMTPGWYIFKICNTGSFEFIIGSNINQCQQAGYYDWSLWKYTSTTCTKILNNQLSPLRCNWNGVSGGGTGICDTLNLPGGGNKWNYEPPIPVNADDSLVLCFSNYSGVNYFIDFIAVGTSSINCSIVTSVPSHENIKSKAFIYNSDLNKLEISDVSIKSISIHDVQGKEIYKSTISETNFIDCSNFNKGLYFITYYPGNNKAATEKILID